MRCATKTPPLLFQTWDLNSDLGGTAICNKNPPQLQNSSLGTENAAFPFKCQSRRWETISVPLSNTGGSSVELSSLRLATKFNFGFDFFKWRRYSHDDFWDRDEIRREGRTWVWPGGSEAAGKSRRMDWWRVAIKFYVISVCKKWGWGCTTSWWFATGYLCVLLSFPQAGLISPFQIFTCGGRGHELPGKNMTMDMIFQYEMNFTSLYKVRVAWNMCLESEQ